MSIARTGTTAGRGLPTAAPSLEPRLLDVFNVAHRLSTSDEFVRRLLRSRQLVAVRIAGLGWRVDPVDLEAFIDARRSKANEGPIW